MNDAKQTSVRAIPVFDGDSHVLEPAAIWDEYLEPEYRVAARTAFWHQEGDISPVTILNGRVAHEPYFPMDPARRGPTMQMALPHKTVHLNIPRHGVWRPGMTVEDVGSLDPNTRHEPNPGANDPRARLKDMDLMGIDQALVFPTYFAEYFPLIENPDIAAALARAYNDWIWDFSRAQPDRLFPVAVLPVQEINAATKELHRVARLGFKAAFIRPLFVRDRYPHHPYYYPLWQALEETGLLYCSHPSWGINAPEMDCEAPFIERVTANLNIGHPVAEALSGCMDNGVLLTGMMAEGLLEKFPNLRFYFVHSKASWLHLFLKKVQGYLWLSSQAEPVSLQPDRIFLAGSTLINFDSSESSIWELPDWWENVASWGSFYPNHDTYTPEETITKLENNGISSNAVEKLMGGNLARVLGMNIRPSAS